METGSISQHTQIDDILADIRDGKLDPTKSPGRDSIASVLADLERKGYHDDRERACYSIANARIGRYDSLVEGAAKALSTFFLFFRCSLHLREWHHTQIQEYFANRRATYLKTQLGIR